MSTFHIPTVGSGHMSNRSGRQSPDDRLEALGRIERRRLLLRLSAATSRGGSHVDFGELDRTAGELDPLVTMRHLHLPVLEEREFVDWDRENHRVTRGSRFEELKPFLDALRDLQEDLPSRWV